MKNFTNFMGNTEKKKEKKTVVEILVSFRKNFVRNFEVSVKKIFQKFVDILRKKNTFERILRNT